MSRTSVFSLIFILFLPAIMSCDLINSDSEILNLQKDPWISFVSEARHLGWKDEITLHNSGLLVFNRLKGEKKPDAARALFDDEILHFINLSENLHGWTGTCNEYDNSSPRQYSITIHSEDGPQTLLCDDSSLGRSDSNKPLRPVLSFLRDLQMSMWGEVRFDDKLTFDLKPRKKVVNLDEPVDLQYIVLNRSDREITMSFPSSAQRGVKIYRDGEIIFSTAAFASLGVITYWEIPAWSAKSKEYAWDHSSFDGSIYHDRKVNSGTYTVIQYLQNGNSPYQATEITITEQGEQKLQSRVLYNRFDDPFAFSYELINRISEPYEFDFSSNRKVGFQIREYDTQRQTPGNVIYSNISGEAQSTNLKLDAFKEYTWTETWDLTGSDGNPVPNDFYWAEMWLMDHNPDYRAGRRVFIQQ
jgi:hypothetical protein